MYSVCCRLINGVNLLRMGGSDVQDISFAYKILGYIVPRLRQVPELHLFLVERLAAVWEIT